MPGEQARLKERHEKRIIEGYYRAHPEKLHDGATPSYVAGAVIGEQARERRRERG